jgi:hypothetical protein
MATVTGEGYETSPAALAILGWYTINGQPASSEDARVMAARGLTFADYWVRKDGDWGVAGSRDVQGNIYGRRPDLAERGLLYASSEWLSARALRAA